MIIVGICSSTTNATWSCQCSIGWQGNHCEIQINYCENVQCLNGGVCRHLYLGYKCECLDQSYSGEHCEIVPSRILHYQRLSTSFASIAIIAMITVFIFIITMDVLKYGFGIDPIKKEIQRTYQRKKKTKRSI